MQQIDPALLDSLIKIYPMSKRLLLHTPWPAKEITGTQRLALLTLAGCKTMTMTLLAQSMACSKEQATRAVAPLVDQGYVQRCYDRDNRTRVWVTLTEAGRAMIHQEYLALTLELETLLGQLSDQELEAFQEALGTVARLLEKVLS